MSGELATLLTGRYVELSMMPLSFKEFCEGLNEERQTLSTQEKFNLYLTIGSFPYVLRYQYGMRMPANICVRFTRAFCSTTS